MFEYFGEVIRVVNGNTLDLSISLGFDIKYQNRFTLARIEVDEKTTTNGFTAFEFLKMFEGKIIKIKIKDMKEFPYLIEAFIKEERKIHNLNDLMLVSNLGKRIEYKNKSNQGVNSNVNAN
jgi:hypothetical protein